MEHAVDGIERQLQRVRGNLGANRFESLADGRRADIDRDLAVSFEHEARTLLRTGGAAFDVAADGSAVISPLDELALQRSFGRPGDLLKTTIERAAVIAAVGLRSDVERLDRREPIGHLVFGDQIAAPELDRVEAKLSRRDIEQALAKEIGLDAPRSAISSRRRLVGHRQRNVDADVGNAVGPREHLRNVARSGRPVGADVCALVAPGMAAQGKDRTVAVARDLQLAGGLAGMVGGEEMLSAVFDPLDRPAAETGGKRDEKVFGIEFAACAEAAADVILDHADRAFGQSEQGG